MTKLKALPLFLLFLLGVVNAYTPVYSDPAGLTVSMVLTLINAALPYWAVFALAILIFLAIKTLGG